MRICVAGLWHLGVVTAACVAAAGHRVVAFDEDAAVVAGLSNGVLPVDEPGLAELVAQGLADATLEFTDRREQALADAELVWIAYDTPVAEDDRADVEFVLARARAIVDASDPSAVILISSQLPVGTTRLLERPGRTLAYSPENLRLGDAVAAFTRPDRIVVGVRPQADRRRIEELLGAFSGRIEWMGVESAELVKHGINAFLAMSISFANELGGIAERVGADAAEVERGLKTEGRIGPRAYVRPGAAFAGGTLARDIDYLTRIGDREGVPTLLLAAVRASNDEHRRWALRTVQSLVEPSDSLDGHVIGVWGLVYKQGTDTLRRSSAVELCRELTSAGARVKAHDAAVRAMPDDLAGSVTLCPTPLDAAQDATAIVIATDWPAYRAVDPERLVSVMRTPNVLDANGFLLDTLGGFDAVHYIRVGSPAT
ncbi:MAG TPA: nucleotide sugar dehydrogenase [Gaiella sp.]|nr:nucleotide sugar dehydrogenase [Gaiella sp.]